MTVPAPRPAAGDPGRQNERTLMAWLRTGAALAAVSLLLTRLVPRSGWAVLAVTSVGLVAALSVVVLQDRRHSRRSRRPPDGALEPALVSTVLLTAVVLALSIAAAVLVLA